MSVARESDRPMLLAQHADLIGGSAISGAVALARGYFSATSQAQLERCGFGRAQRRAPSLVLPVWDVRGELVMYQLRADRPRIVRGKPLKYETPAGATMRLDVPPGARDRLGDPSVPLFITEGIRKADAAVSAGLCAIDVIGTWSWRGTNEWGGKTALADWESVALNGRTVYVVYDSDIMEKDGVRLALERLVALLKQRGPPSA